MQLLSHLNLAKFVGACLEPGSMIILMEYCPRGSLQVSEENEPFYDDQGFLVKKDQLSTKYHFEVCPLRNAV